MVDVRFTGIQTAGIFSFGNHLAAGEWATTLSQLRVPWNPTITSRHGALPKELGGRVSMATIGSWTQTSGWCSIHRLLPRQLRSLPRGQQHCLLRAARRRLVSQGRRMLRPFRSPLSLRPASRAVQRRLWKPLHWGVGHHLAEDQSPLSKRNHPHQLLPYRLLVPHLRCPLCLQIEVPLLAHRASPQLEEQAAAGVPPASPQAPLQRPVPMKSVGPPSWHSRSRLLPVRLPLMWRLRMLWALRPLLLLWLRLLS